MGRVDSGITRRLSDDGDKMFWFHAVLQRFVESDHSGRPITWLSLTVRERFRGPAFQLREGRALPDPARCGTARARAGAPNNIRGQLHHGYSASDFSGR